MNNRSTISVKIIDSKDCDKIKFQRNIDDKKVSEEIYNQVKDILIKEKVVFFWWIRSCQYAVKKNKKGS